MAKRILGRVLPGVLFTVGFGFAACLLCLLLRFAPRLFGLTPGLRFGFAPGLVLGFALRLGVLFERCFLLRLVPCPLVRLALVLRVGLAPRRFV